MNKEKYDNELDVARYKFNRVAIANVILSLSVIVLVMALVWAVANEKVILKTPYSDISKDSVVGNGVINDEELNRFGYYVASISQNVTYKNVEENLMQILPLVESSNFENIKTDLQKEAKSIKANKITQMFYPGNIDISAPGVIKINGVRMRMVTGRKLKDSYEDLILEIKYVVKHGTFFRIKNIGITKK